MKSDFFIQETCTAPDTNIREVRARNEINDWGEGKNVFKFEDSKEDNLDINEKQINQEIKTLVLKVIDGKFFPNGFKINITPFELNGKQPINEEKFLFGKDSTSNDFNFPPDENVGINQFEIKFDKGSQLYYIKDIKKGTGSFVKVIKRQAIDQDYIFSFCNSHMIVYKTKADNFLHFKFLLGQFKNKLFYFNPKENKTIRIGRSKHAEVSYKDESVSRYQLTFVFENNKWFVYDGYKEKTSTNGLWMFASKKIAFFDGMILKTGNTTFKANIV
jgi:hypothetical protein